MSQQMPIIEEIKNDFFEDYGFENQEHEIQEVFSLKPFSIEGFPVDQSLVSFGINDHNIVLATDRKKIFRWRFKEDDGCVELPIKTTIEGDITDQIMKLSGQVGKQIGGAVLNTVSLVTKPLFNTSMKRSKKDSEDGRLDCIFLEPRGNHLIVASNKGEVYHACRDEIEVRALEGLDNASIRFLLWGECSLYSFKNSIIIGSNNKVYIYNLIYNNEKLMHTEEISKSILQINETEKIKDLKKVVKNSVHTVLIMTDQYIYVLSGTKDLIRLFQKYSEAPDLFIRSRVPLKDKSLNPKIFIHQDQIIWTNGSNILLSACKGIVENQTFQNPIKLKNFKRSSDEIKLELLYGIGLTKYHYYLLTFDTLTVISLLTHTVIAYFEINTNTFGKAQGMHFDPGTECFWIWCLYGIFRLNVEFEDQDIWKILVDLKMYEEALEVTQKYDNPYYGHISGTLADILYSQALALNPNKLEGNEQIQAENFSEITYVRNRHNKETFKDFQMDGRTKTVFELTEVVELKKQLYRKAALRYFGSNKPFEEVILQFEQGELIYNSDGLIDCYLKPMIDLLDSELKQIVFKKIIELLIMETDNNTKIKKFLDQYKNEIQVETAMPILQAHGLSHIQTYFIELKQDHKTVVQSLLIQEDYKAVQQKLSSLNDDDLLINLVYKYSYVIMKYNTQQTLDLFKKIEKFDPQKMVSILLDIPINSKELAVQFMAYCIFVRTKKITEINFNNLYLQYLADLGKTEQIMYYINDQMSQHENGEKYKFDLNYASQLFLKKKLLQPYVYILQMLGDYENAVKKAVEIDLVQDAKNIALQCDDATKQRQLWILQIRLMLEKGGKYVKQIVQLTRDIPAIKAEDILPYLTQNIKLDDFKDEICETLEEYHEQIKKQQQLLDGYITSNENLDKLMLQKSNRYITVQAKSKCEYCFRKLLLEDFVVFECSHSFHKECIVQYIKQNPEVLEPKAFQSLLYLEKQLQEHEKINIQRIQNKSDESLFGFFSASVANNQMNQKNQKMDQKHKLQTEFDTILSNECPLCGIFIIEQVLLPLDNDEYMEETWLI